jgi:serine/threonine protein kinase HipA of HipAB toxin-antitoxin module
VTVKKTETEDERKARLKAERDKQNEKRIKFVDSRFDRYNGDTLVLSK